VELKTITKTALRKQAVFGLGNYPTLAIG